MTQPNESEAVSVSERDDVLTAAMDNVLAWRIGEAFGRTAKQTAGDYIDRGLVLLRELREGGLGLVKLTDDGLFIGQHSRALTASPSGDLVEGVATKDPRYLRPGFDFALSHAIEEVGEFLAAAGKTQRWGRDSVNPDLPPEGQETNEAWLCREMADVRGAFARLDTALRATPSPLATDARGGEQRDRLVEALEKLPAKLKTLLSSGHTCRSIEAA